MKQALFSRLASLVQAAHNCQKNGNTEWQARHTDKASGLVREHLPSGSGFDSGTSLDWDHSTAEKLVFRTSFHHMDEHGFYDGWTDHSVTVRASLLYGITVSVSGKNRNGIKDYIAEQFQHCASIQTE